MIRSPLSIATKSMTLQCATNDYVRFFFVIHSTRGMASLRRTNHQSYHKSAKTNLDPSKSRHASSASTVQYNKINPPLQHLPQPHQQPFPKPSEEEEAERVAAVRLFLDSLQLATANTTLFNTTTALDRLQCGSSGNIREGPTITAALFAGDNFGITYNCEEVEISSAIGSEEESEGSCATQEPKPNLAGEGGTKTEYDRFVSVLRRSINHKNVKKSMAHFQKCQRNNHVLPQDLVSNLFFMVSETDPVSAYSITQYYNTHYIDKENVGRFTDLDSSTNKRLSLYKRLAASISLLDPKRHNTRQMHILVNSLLHEIEEMDNDSKQVLYPRLINSLVTQRIATIGVYARKLYESMEEDGFEMRIGWLKRLLSMSRYNRQDDLPYHEIMEQLVQTPGGRLNPDWALPAIQNMFPFTDTEAVCVALRAWLDNFHNEFGGDMIPPSEDLIALSTLESISIGASQAGVSELILLVWEVLEACRYSPTETLYENTVIAFANEKGGLQQAFASMAAMREDGFEPSRPLIRSFSSVIRLHRSVIGRARRILIEDRQNEMSTLENHSLLSLDSFNVVLSSYAERGDSLDAVETLDLMSDYDIEPNSDSYSFVVEALGRDIKKRLKTEDYDYMERNVSIANTVLTMMEENEVAPNTHVIRNYVELLCLAGEIETATSTVEDYLRSSDPIVRNTINNITIYRVALETASLGDFERAKALAAQMTEHVPALHRRIKSREQRSLYLQETMEASVADKERKT